jgi:hypothetical protein
MAENKTDHPCSDKADIPVILTEENKGVGE